MRRPDIELTGNVAAFVEQHPDLAEQMAGRADDRSIDTPEISALRAKVRSRVRERLTAGRTEEAQADRRAAGQAFLAQYGVQ